MRKRKTRCLGFVPAGPGVFDQWVSLCGKTQSDVVPIRGWVYETRQECPPGCCKICWSRKLKMNVPIEVSFVDKSWRTFYETVCPEFYVLTPGSV